MVIVRQEMRSLDRDTVLEYMNPQGVSLGQAQQVPPPAPDRTPAQPRDALRLCGHAGRRPPARLSGL